MPYSSHPKRMMRNILFLCLFFAAALVRAQQSCPALTVSGSADWNPIIMNGPDGRYGIGIDLANQIGKDLNIPIQFVEMPWKRILKSLEVGSLDMVLGIYHTEERQLYLAYTPAFMQNEGRVYTLSDRTFSISSLNNLVGRIGDLPLGGSFGDHFDDFARRNLNLSYVDNKEQRIERLMKRYSDYFVSDQLDTDWHLRQHGLEERIVALPYTVSQNPVHLAISRRSACLRYIQAISDLIDSYHNDGTMQAIITAYRKN